MICGAVIIGRSIGPNLIRPFSVSDFYSLKTHCNLALVTECPISVAYPKTLSDSKLAYQEGVLVNICEGEDEEQFRRKVKERLIFAAKKAETIYSEFRQRGEDLPWEGQSDLDSQKVCWFGSLQGVEGLVYKPFMEVIEVYDYTVRHIRYSAIALDLSTKTMEARKKRAIEKEEWNHKNNMGLVGNWIKIK